MKPLCAVIPWLGAVVGMLAEPASQRPVLPTRPDAVVRQASAAVTRAFTEGAINRQTIRLPLSDSMYSEKDEGFVADRAIGWQGGPQETIQYLSPLASQLLREVKIAEQTGGLPPRVSEQMLLDFDGSTLLTTESAAGPLFDVQALLQPNTDQYYLDVITKVEDQFSDEAGKAKRLFLLVNPAWRDKSSWGFFGGDKAQKLILDRYETTFAIDQFVVRGQKMSLMKSWPHDWCVYLTPMAAGGGAELIGTFENRPEYSKMDDLLRDVMKKKEE